MCKWLRPVGKKNSPWYNPRRDFYISSFFGCIVYVWFLFVKFLFDPQILSRFHISFLPPSKLIIDLHYQCSMYLTFPFYGSHFCQKYQLFYNMGVGFPQEGVTCFNILSPNTHLLVSRLITEKLIEIHT